MNNDLEAVSRFFEQAASQIVRTAVQVVLIIVMALVICQLTLAALLIVPMMLLATFALQRVSTPAFALMQEELGRLSGFQDNLRPQSHHQQSPAGLGGRQERRLCR